MKEEHCVEIELLHAEIASLYLQNESILAPNKSSVTTTSLPVLTHVFQPSLIVHIAGKEHPEIISVAEEADTSLTDYGLKNTASVLYIQR